MKDDNIISDFDQNFETLKKQSILIEKQKSENTTIYRHEADKKFIVTKPLTSINKNDLLETTKSSSNHQGSKPSIKTKWHHNWEYFFYAPAGVLGFYVCLKMIFFGSEEQRGAGLIQIYFWGSIAIFFASIKLLGNLGQKITKLKAKKNHEKFMFDFHAKKEAEKLRALELRKKRSESAKLAWAKRKDKLS